jgi:hypothetical protein
VIEPRRTRPYLIRALEASLSKREPGPKRKHGNIPLYELGAMVGAVTRSARSWHRLVAFVVDSGDRIESGWWDGVPHEAVANCANSPAEECDYPSLKPRAGERLARLDPDRQAGRRP